MFVATSDCVLAFIVALCGVVCLAGYLLAFSLSRRLHESRLRPVIGPAQLLAALAFGMLLGICILASRSGQAPGMSAGSPLLAVLVPVMLIGLCAGGWSARPQLGSMPVSGAGLVRRLCVAGDTHEDATARVAVRLALASGYDRARASDLMAAASLHDIGMSGLPASIRDKIRLGAAGGLDAHERQLLRDHPRIGHRMLARSGEPMLDLAADIALHHHECWDGSGYPAGLSGEAIPLASRAVALAEAFDRMLGAGPALPRDLAGALQQDAGRRFDPRLVALLLADLSGMTSARNGETAHPFVFGGPERMREPELAAAWVRPGRFRSLPSPHPAF